MGDVDAHALASHSFYKGAGDPAVVSPSLCAQAGIECMIYFFGDQVKDFDAIDYSEGQGCAVRNHHGPVSFARQNRRQRSHIERAATIALLPIGTFCSASRIVASERLIPSPAPAMIRRVCLGFG